MRGGVALTAPDGPGQRVAGPALKHARGAAQAAGDGDLQVLYQRRLACSPGREHQCAQALLAGGLRDGERAVARAHLAVERELAEERVALQALSRELAAGDEHRARQRQVEARGRPSARRRERDSR